MHPLICLTILLFNLCFWQQFRLVCPDRTTRSVDEYLTCNWGQISSNVIMTSAVRSADVIKGYKAFLTKAVEWFGPDGTYKSAFEMFRSNTTYDTDEFALTFSRKNQMFSDQTKHLEDVPDSTTYFDWVGMYHGFWFCFSLLYQWIICTDLIIFVTQHSMYWIKISSVDAC